MARPAPDAAQLSLFDGAAPGAPAVPRKLRPVPSVPPVPPVRPEAPEAPADTAAAPSANAELRPSPPRPATSPRPSPGKPPAPPPERPGREVRLEDRRVPYRLRRARRRSIGFVIDADGLSVAAPGWVGVAEIEAALRAKAAWILRKLDEQTARAARQQAARIDWTDGAVVPYLGGPLAVRFDAALPAGEVRVEAEGDVPTGLCIGGPAALASGAVRGWLQREARRLFEARCAVYAPQLGVQYRRLALSSAATRWGSASADGSIRLHWRLVHLPIAVVDYVVAHELAHLREMNHSARFWRLVASVVPDHQALRRSLRSAVLPVLD